MKNVERNEKCPSQTRLLGLICLFVHTMHLSISLSFSFHIPYNTIKSDLVQILVIYGIWVKMNPSDISTYKTWEIFQSHFWGWEIRGVLYTVWWYSVIPVSTYTKAIKSYQQLNCVFFRKFKYFFHCLIFPPHFVKSVNTLKEKIKNYFLLFSLKYNSELRQFF